MKQTGAVQGEAARRYKPFCYRKAITIPLNIFNVNEHIQLVRGQEYPCFRNPPNQDTLKTVELCDYEVCFEKGSQPYLKTLVVRLLPNQYTQSKHPSIVFKGEVANSNLFHKEYIKEALEKVFGQ